jgi:hypothetical protein
VVTVCVNDASVIIPWTKESSVRSVKQGGVHELVSGEREVSINEPLMTPNYAEALIGAEILLNPTLNDRAPLRAAMVGPTTATRDEFKGR